MPVYAFDVDVPANTTEFSPVRQTVDLTVGQIRQVDIGFPLNAAGQVRVGIFDGVGKILPANPEGWVFWNDHVFSFPEVRDLVSDPPTLTLVAWNSDDAFSHRVYVWFTVVPFTTKEVMEKLGPIAAVKEKILKVFS